MQTAKIFWSGRSQAVRLPKEFRFDGEAVRIRRHGNAVILEPVAGDWSWLDSITGRLDDDFVAAEGQERGGAICAARDQNGDIIDPRCRALGRSGWTSRPGDEHLPRH